MIEAHKQIEASGVQNFQKCRIQIPSKFNFPFIERELADYPGKIIIDYLKFGFPLGHDGVRGSSALPKNHTGATQFPEQMEQMLEKELNSHAAIGPFNQVPFEKYALSPLNSVPKKDSAKRRLILDLSMPRNNAVNESIDKDNYMGETDKLMLPSVDKLVERVMQLGKNCKLFKVDLQRAYRQVYLDPKQINFLGYVYKGKFMFDCTLSMGSKSSTRCCQMVTTAVVFIYTKHGFFAINYLDDLGSAETEEKAQEAYLHMKDLLIQFGLQEAHEKSVAPCTSMTFLGIEVNSVELSLKIPEVKWQEIQSLLKDWKGKKSASLKEVQSLAGVLNFACRCVVSGRIYLSRILNFLRQLPKVGKRYVPESVKRDISWWIDFAPRFNGISLMMENSWSEVDQEFSSDSCLTGGGAFMKGRFCHFKYPTEIQKLNLNINQLECMMVVIALKVWGNRLERKRLVINCDNMNSVLAINSGASRDLVLQNCLRELHVVQAQFSCTVKAKHISSEDNRISDSLSRWHLHGKFKKTFQEITSDMTIIQDFITHEHFRFMF